MVSNSADQSGAIRVVETKWLRGGSLFFASSP